MGGIMFQADVHLTMEALTVQDLCSTFTDRQELICRVLKKNSLQRHRKFPLMKYSREICCFTRTRHQMEV